MSKRWQASATNETLKKRAEIIRAIRRFFDTRTITAVETPLLADTGSSDPHLQSIGIEYRGTRYLQTSPEQHMKRLLACGIGDIYQICKAFRQDESGKKHNPEFTLLEWYRIGVNLEQLAQECCQLIHEIADNAPQTILSTSYTKLFNEYCGIEPTQCTKSALIEQLPKDNREIAKKLDTYQLLDLVFSSSIEPNLGHDCLQIIVGFPTWQASLAQTTTEENNQEVSMRFEIYWQGTELANGYQELLDSRVLKQRYNDDCKRRKQLDIEQMPYMKQLHAAMSNGLPECSGVALGVDRLVMLATGANSINEVISFPFCDA